MACGMKVGGYFDLRENTKNPFRIPYIGAENKVDVKNIVGDNAVFPAVGDNMIREKMVALFESLSLRQITIIDPAATVSASANLSKSVFIGKGAKINALAIIGTGTIINTGSVVEHECEVGDYVHIAPSATLCGDVHVGRSSFVGANAVIIQGIRVHNNCTLGAGSVLLKHTNGPGETWVGNPARKIV